MSATQKQIAQWIEQGFYQLVKNAEVENFQTIIQQAIDDKRKGATTQEFCDRLMLNLAYYERNAAVWHTTTQALLTGDLHFTTAVVETELLTGQMQVRQEVDEQTAVLIPLFHEQYVARALTEDIIMYDYAYMSIAHALRVDFLTVCAMQDSNELLTQGDATETIRIMDGYVNYYADQFARQLQLH